MRIQKGSKKTEEGVLARVQRLEHRCDALEHEMDILALADRLRQAMRRIAELESRAHAKHAA